VEHGQWPQTVHLHLSIITMHGGRAQQIIAVVLGIIHQIHAVHSGTILIRTLIRELDKVGAILQATGEVECAAADSLVVAASVEVVTQVAEAM